ncbi:TonB family protein [Solidesulfovibrio fructosivorans JJ]]|uniref:TonB family protein n=1 Tax=Solidesulfovibrio fructosivorans JJ] TaxID=596151 RepID=E1JXE3_SOLFR|nr:energy transducer TonB [Solidesulfovibrio fructosivorans]EFL50920.1 TonB family protein [Solidesulfovibrio fructosivorans JJ]]
MSLAAVDAKPRILRQVTPDYPADARRRGIEGRVVARLLVTADGGVRSISIVSAKPPQVFEHAVIAALGQWRFHPARYKGREVATWVMLPVKFDLKN